MVFEEQWPLMRPTILKLLRQEPVSRAEWHELFWSVHMVCLWDEKSHAKMYKALQDDILEFIKQAQTVSCNYSQLKLCSKYKIFEIYQLFIPESTYSRRRPVIAEGLYQ